jgi:hypothetical protein
LTGEIHITPRGNFGNRTLQYLAALGIQQHAPAARITNLMLPELGMDALSAAPAAQDTVGTGIDGFDLDVAGLADCLNRGVVRTVLIEGYPFNLQNYPPRPIARGLIPATSGGADAQGFAAHELVCSVRGAEILHNIHPDYLLLPPAYYRQLAERSGLELVFYGQIDDDPYCATLRVAFPAARFVKGRCAEYDFEVLRRSANIAPSISTFAWLAAWLSHATKVYLPVGGIFSPVQVPHMMFLPLDDPAYEYTLLPYAKGVDLYDKPARFFYLQDMLGTFIRPAAAQELREICDRAAAFAGRRPLLSGFDQDYYIAENKDVADGLIQKLPSALHHYVHAGFREGRRPLRLDPVFYTAFYPDAAMAIAEGRYADPIHHYLTVGRSQGYRALP